MWYTDGVALFKSSKFGIWPLFFAINELPYSKRTKSENLLFGGLWFGETKPSMGTFLKPFITTLQTLYKEGVTVDCRDCNDKIKVKGMLLCGTCDLPAKCIVLNMNQFNGECGCARCKQVGKVVAAGKGHVRVFPFQTADPYGPPRTHKETKLHAAAAMQQNKAVCGIKGPSWFSYLQMDVIRGTAIDYMHTVLLGVVRRLLTLWFSSKFSSEPFSIAKHADTVDERLLSIKPPNYVSRVPRSIKEHSSYWKANECRSWLLFYSVPVLYGLMDEEYLQHYILLVESIFLLSSDSLTKRTLKKAKSLLTYFVCLHEALYGERHMSANIHQLIHLPENAKDLGPLWVYGCFSFEDMNGQLVKLFHGTQHPEVQISAAISTLMYLPECGHKLDKESPVGIFYTKLRKKGENITKNICGGVSIVGRRVIRVLANVQFQAILKASGSLPKEVLCFYRMLKDGKLYQSLQYKAVEERNSYTVMFLDETGAIKLGHVENYVEVYLTCSNDCQENCDCEPKYYAIIKELEKNTNICLKNGVTHGSGPSNIHPVKSKYVGYTAVSLMNISDLCVYVQLNDDNQTAFVTVSPNSLEGD